MALTDFLVYQRVSTFSPDQSVPKMNHITKSISITLLCPKCKFFRNLCRSKHDEPLQTSTTNTTTTLGTLVTLVDQNMQNMQNMQKMQNRHNMQDLVTVVALVTLITLVTLVALVTLVSGHPVHPGAMQGSHISSTTWSSFGEKEARIFYPSSTAIA